MYIYICVYVTVYMYIYICIPYKGTYAQVRNCPRKDLPIPATLLLPCFSGPASPALLPCRTPSYRTARKQKNEGMHMYTSIAASDL